MVVAGCVPSTRDIASSFLAQDGSQIDYYAEITKRMPGKVLGRHNLVKREGMATGWFLMFEGSPPSRGRP